MTDEELDKLEEFARDADQGEWRASRMSERHGGGWIIGSDTYEDAQILHCDTSLASENAKFIAVANPATVLRLIDRIRGLELSEDVLMRERDARVEQIEHIADELGDDSEWSDCNDRGDNAIGLAAAHVRELARVRGFIEDCHTANGAHENQLGGGYLDYEPHGASPRRRTDVTYRIRFGGSMIMPMRGVPSLDVAMIIASDFTRCGPFDDHAPWMTHLEPEERCNACRKRTKETDHDG